MSVHLHGNLFSLVLRTCPWSVLALPAPADGAQVDDPYTVVMRSKKLPMQLLVDPTKAVKMDLLSAESFSSVFGPKKTRKKPKLSVPDLDSLATTAQDKVGKYVQEDDTNVERDEELRDLVGDKVFDKGTSKRIWGELYKVLDCSDVVIQVRRGDRNTLVSANRCACANSARERATVAVRAVTVHRLTWSQLPPLCVCVCVQVLDARDPMGTRSPRVETHLKESAKHKHLIFVLNKCDLVPTWVTKR